jgi:hypothetical protein
VTVDETAAPAEEKATDETTPSGGRSASELREVADALRNRVDLFGKTLAAVATLGTTAVGLSEIGDLFPYDGNLEWVYIACGGLALAALAAIWVAVLLMRVARPVFISANLDTNSELDKGERDEVRPVLEAAAQRYGFSSLIALEEYERSVRNVAYRATDERERTRQTALANEIKAETEQALARGQVVTIRRRASRAMTRDAFVPYVLVIVGLIAFALGTDKVSSDRKDLVAQAKACGDARKAGATAQELAATNVCEGEGEETEEDPEPLSAAQARAQISGQLTAALQACADLVQTDGNEEKSAPLDGKDCDPVRQAVSAMDPAGSESAADTQPRQGE